MPITPKQDAYGRLVHDYFRGARVTEIVERDDGFIAPSGGPVTYFAPYDKWPRFQQRAMAFVRGRVLDIGCGPGRVALYLQQRGHSVLAVDNSPLAVRTARLRGVRDAQVLSVTQLNRRLGLFDTIVLFGNNFGLMANPQRARWLLRRFAGMTSERAAIVAEILDPYDTKVPEHRRYHRRNRARGRMAGQSRIRVRYKDTVTPWFDYLFVSRMELRRLLRGSAWKVTHILDSPGPTYIAVLTKALHGRTGGLGDRRTASAQLFGAARLSASDVLRRRANHVSGPNTIPWFE